MTSCRQDSPEAREVASATLLFNNYLQQRAAIFLLPGSSEHRRVTSADFQRLCKFNSTPTPYRLMLAFLGVAVVAVIGGLYLHAGLLCMHSAEMPGCPPPPPPPRRKNDTGKGPIGIGRSLAAPPSHTTGRTGHVSGGSMN
jgi:hypothetical protein